MGSEGRSSEWGERGLAVSPVPRAWSCPPRQLFVHVPIGWQTLIKFCHLQGRQAGPPGWVGTVKAKGPSLQEGLSRAGPQRRGLPVPPAASQLGRLLWPAVPLITLDPEPLPQVRPSSPVRVPGRGLYPPGEACRSWRAVLGLRLMTATPLPGPPHP